ncbi:MAG: hypothetical protein GY749_33500 [Desulfobacteraceae bacterium]|nr:hypothetical protein [Desulfobacteraceae bacterium]
MGGDIGRCNEILSESIRCLRNLSYSLRPSGLEKFGLTGSLRKYCSEFTGETGIKADFNVFGNKEDFIFDYDTSINLYRLVQESFNNTKKHAGATQVSVTLTALYPFVILRTQDNGGGFDTGILKTLDEKHMGLSGMAERTSCLDDGRMNIESEPGKGTQTTIKFRGNYDEESNNNTC